MVGDIGWIDALHVGRVEVGHDAFPEVLLLCHTLACQTADEGNDHQTSLKHYHPVFLLDDLFLTFIDIDTLLRRPAAQLATLQVIPTIIHYPLSIIN